MRRLLLCLLLLPALALADGRGLRRPRGPKSTAVYYVAPTGTNSHTCAQAQSPATPRLTIAEGIRCLAAGDTLYLRQGTYAEWIGYPNNPAPPSGLSWDQATTIAGYPGETVRLQPPSTQGVVVFAQGEPRQYLIVDHLILDGTHIWDATVNFGHNTYTRVSNSEVYRPKEPRGANIFGGKGHNELLGNTIHGGGGYGWYMSSGDNLVEGNTIADHGGYGLHVYSSVPQQDQVHRNVIRHNVFTGNGFDFIHSGTGQRQYLAALIISSGGGHQVYNNVIVGNYQGVQVDYSQGQTVPHQVFNNTITGNQRDGIYVGSTVTGAQVQNNIVWGNGVPLTDHGAGTVMTNNLSTDPGFVAPDDYHLAAQSTALDAGVTLASVTTDFEGNARPQAQAYDIGAYERVSMPVPPEPVPVAALVCHGDLLAGGKLAMECVPKQEGRR